VPAFCLNDPSDRFMSFAIFDTGVFAFECCLSNLMSAAVYGLRVGLVFFALANLFSSNWMARHIIFVLIIKRNDLFACFVWKRPPRVRRRGGSRYHGLRLCCANSYLFDDASADQGEGR
jgi:hypothetical protein